MSFGVTWEPCKTHQKHMAAYKTWAKGVFAAFTVISCNLRLAKEFPKIRKRHVRVHYHVPNYPNLRFVRLNVYTSTSKLCHLLLSRQVLIVHTRSLHLSGLLAKICVVARTGPYGCIWPLYVILVDFRSPIGLMPGLRYAVVDAGDARDDPFDPNMLDMNSVEGDAFGDAMLRQWVIQNLTPWQVTGSSSSIASTRLAMLRMLRNQLDLQLFSAWPHLEGCQALTVAHRPTLTCSCAGCTKHWLLWRPLTKGWMVIQSFSHRCKTSLQCESKKGGDLVTALHAAQIKFGFEIHRQSLPWVLVAQLTVGTPLWDVT